MWHRTRPYYAEQDDGISGPEDGMPGSLTVHEEDHDGFSGLYDSEGKPLYRRKRGIGFILDDE
jgi:hypothetical protein